jgi:hypothetical protein
VKRNTLVYLGLIAAAASFTACSDAASPNGEVVTDAQINADVAAASGEAIATDIAELIANENFAGLPAAASPVDLFPSPRVITVNRTRTCYGGGGVAQAACNATTTDSVRLTVTMDGSFSRNNTTPHGTESMNVALHRARALTISGLAGTETSRTHDGAGSGSDTTQFSGTNDSTSRSRTMTSAGTDSVQNIVFNLPRSSNPWPVSGKIIRNVAGKVTVVGGPRPGERTFSRRIEVTFPADAQGNVSIKVNDKTCTLNLTTRVVANCST